MTRTRGGSARGLRRPRRVTGARWAAWQTVRRTFDEEAWTDRAFTAEVEAAGLDDRDRRFAQRLAFGTVQRARTLDLVIATLGRRPLARLDPPVLHALRLGMYELLVLRDDGSSAHAAVDQAVELVRGVVGERATAFTNAVLRRAQVDGVGILRSLDPTDDDDLAVLLSMPTWLVTRARAALGSEGIAALAAQNAPGEFRSLLDGTVDLRPGGARTGTSFRVNRVHRDAGQLAEALAVAGLTDQIVAAAAPHDHLDEALVLEGATRGASTLVDDGLLVPQSLASMHVARALGVAPGNRVADLCAAPGGKATHLAELVGEAGQVLACDLHEHRVDSVRALAQRLGLADRVEVRAGDAREVDDAHRGAFDAVLLDAPCTGSGVLDRRPDARWRRSEEGLAELTVLQTELLRAAATMLRPGARLVYSTCSLLPEEGEAIIDAALADPALGLEPAPLPDDVPHELRVPGHEGRMRTWPHRHATDGFFVARLRRAGA